MSNWELHLPPARPDRNPLNGRFLKGRVPMNKGLRWDDYMPKRSQRRSAKGWKNLQKHRVHSPNAGRKRKPVIALMDDGKIQYFPALLSASVWIGGNVEGVRTCCRLNLSRKELNGPTGRPRGKVNTDHRYKGVRFYFEEDPIWMSKINKR